MDIVLLQITHFNREYKIIDDIESTIPLYILLGVIVGLETGK